MRKYVIIRNGEFYCEAEGELELAAQLAFLTCDQHGGKNTFEVTLALIADRRLELTHKWVNPSGGEIVVEDAVSFWREQAILETGVKPLMYSPGYAPRPGERFGLDWDAVKR